MSNLIRRLRKQTRKLFPTAGALESSFPEFDYGYLRKFNNGDFFSEDFENAMVERYPEGGETLRAYFAQKREQSDDPVQSRKYLLVNKHDVQRQRSI